MRLTIPRQFSRRINLALATTAALVFAVAHVAAQYGTFTSAHEGALWGVRHELALGANGAPAGAAFVNGALYVADQGNQSIVSYDAAGSVIAQFTPADASPNELLAVTVNVNGGDIPALLVSDAATHRVLAFDAAGALLFTMQLDRPGQDSVAAEYAGMAGAIAGLAMAPGSRFVLTATTLALEGSFVAGWTNETESDGAFLAYQDLPAIALTGSFELTPTATLDGTEGTNLAPPNQLPFGVVFDALGNLYTIDTNTERFNVYSSSFVHLFAFGTPQFDGTLAEFNQPYGMAYSPADGGRLYIGDSGSNRVEIYKPNLAGSTLDLVSTIDAFGDGFPRSVAINPTADRLAVSNNGSDPVWVLETPNLAAYNVEVLTALGLPTAEVCAGSAYQVRFSLTVPPGRLAVNDVVPQLFIDGAPVTETPTPAGTYTNPMSAGQVAAYTYSLVMPSSVQLGGYVLRAGATASTPNVLFTEAMLNGANCVGTAPAISATANLASQVSGWTPVLPTETFELTLTANDDGGVQAIEYQITGQNDPGTSIPPVTNPGSGPTQTVVISLPESGLTTVRFRALDTDNRTSAWQAVDLRLIPLVGRQTNENVAVSVMVGSPVGVGYLFEAVGLPAGLAISAETGQIAGVVSFDAAGIGDEIYHVTLTETLGTVSTFVEFDWTIVHVNRSPTIVQPANVPGAVEGVPYALDIDGIDPDGDPSFFTINGHSTIPGHETWTLPPSITINPLTGEITGTFPANSDRQYAISVGLSECASSLPDPPCGGGALPGQRLATLLTMVVDVLDVNQAPTLVNPGDRTNAEGVVISLPTAASDPDGDAISFAAENLPNGLTIDAQTGVISGTIAYDAAGPHAVTIEVADGIGAPTRETFQWVVTETNSVPVVNTALPNRVNDEGEGIAIDVDATDPDGQMLTYAAANLPPGLSIDATTGVISGTLPYSAAGFYPGVTVSVADGTHTVERTFTWTVNEVNRPFTLLALADRGNLEGDPVSLALAAFVDDPDAGALTFTAGPLPQGLTLDTGTGLISGTVGFEAEGSYLVTVTVNDGLTTRTATFTWTVTAVNQLPVLSAMDQFSNEGQTVAVAIPASDLDGNALQFTMSGLPAGFAINAVGLISGTFDFESAGGYDVTVTASDGIAPSSVTFHWTVRPVNRPPVLTVEDLINVEGDVIARQISGTDPDGDQLTFSMNGLPTGFVIDAATGVITGTFDYDSAGTYTVNIGLVDPLVGGHKTFTWRVTEGNRPPVVTALPDRTDAENDTVTVTVTASDADGQALTYSAVNLPPGVAINATTGIITGTLSYTAAGTYAVQVRVFDGLATTTRTFTWVVTNVNRPPTAAAGNRTDPENTTVSFAITSADPDGDVLTFSATGLPAGIAIHPTTGVISGTLGYATGGEYDVVVTVSDGSLTATAPFHWTVTDVNAPPVITTPGNRTNAEGDSVSVAIVASDADGQALTYTASGLPPGLTIDSTGLITGLLSYTTFGTYPAATVTVSDGVTSRSVTFTWTVTNVNQPPVVVNPGTQTSAEGAIVSLPISASDPDGQPLTYSASGLPTGLSINPTTGIITGTLGYAVFGTYTVTVTASDGSLSDSETFVWNVINTNQPPTAVADFANAVQGQSTIITVLGNDTDLDGVATLSVASVTQPASGTGTVVINPNWTVTYTANATFVGTSTFTYTITDGTATSTATVTVNVAPNNRPPVCSAAFTSTDLWPPNHREVYVTISGITDPDGGTPTIRFTSILQDEPTDSVGQGNTMQDGGIVDNGARAWVRAERSGTKKVPGDGRVYLIGFTATDASGASCTGTVRLDVPHDQRGTPAVLSPGRWNSITGQQVSGPPPAPVANDDAVTAASGSPATLPVLGNDVSNGQSLAVTIVSQPAKGQATANSNGTITYTPPSNWTGTTTFTYQVRTPTGGVDTAVVTVTVTRSSDNNCGDRNHDHGRDNDGRDRDHDRGDHRRCQHGDNNHDNDDNDHDDGDNNHGDGDNDPDCGDRNHDHGRDNDGRDRDHNRGNHARCSHSRR